MPGFQSTQLATEGALEPFFFLYTDDSIQGNPETCKQSSIMLNYEVKNNTLPMDFFNSPNRLVPVIKSRRIRTFHLSPINMSVVSTGQAGSSFAVCIASFPFNSFYLAVTVKKEVYSIKDLYKTIIILQIENFNVSKWKIIGVPCVLSVSARSLSER